MGYSQEEGYVPTDIETIMKSLMNGVNAQFSTSYTFAKFKATNFYKYLYALAQELQKNEVKTSEIFLKLQDYIKTTNEKISRPVVTNPGIVEKMEAEGYIASVKPMILADAGLINICVDLDDTDPDYATTKAAVALLISQITVAGAVTQGAESTSIVLSNGQSFDFKYHLPNRIPVGLQLTITTSENNQNLIGLPDETKQKLIDNIEAGYRLGKNFEPQKYFSIADAPWASNILLEWTDDVTDGDIDETPTWSSAVYDADFDDLFEIDLSRIVLVEN